LSLTFKRGHADDLTAVYKLNCEFFSESWSLAGLQGALEEGYELFCCMDKNTLAGYLLSHDVLDEVHIMQVVVALPYRRKNIAEQLSRDLLNIKPNRRLLLEVRASNHAAQALYAKLEFVRSGVRKAYYVPEHKGDAREDAILMHYPPK